ncbi:acyclic terpene utilization AtuA family protein, partial [Achromobacter xylosoxidans]
MVERVRLGAGSGFWGDAQDPAQELLERGNLDYLCFDYLAELTMALLQRQKLKRPDAGYVPDAVQTMISLLPQARASGTKLISNGGGVNPRAAAQRVAEGARRAGLAGSRIALVEGDDMLEKLDDLMRQGVPLRNMDTGDENFAAIRDRVVCANVYTDSSGIIEGLEGEADVVIAGRVSDNALYVGPLAHEFGWRRDAAHIDRYAAAVTLGHIVECAAGCSGGMSSRFADMPHMGRAGFPILEVAPDAEAVVTKLSGTGGRVDQWTIKEHLVYEVGNPRRYLMPDAVADFTSLRLADEGQDRVRVSGVRGEAAP